MYCSFICCTNSRYLLTSLFNVEHKTLTHNISVTMKFGLDWLPHRRLIRVNVTKLITVKVTCFIDLIPMNEIVLEIWSTRSSTNVTSTDLRPMWPSRFVDPLTQLWDGQTDKIASGKVSHCAYGCAVLMCNENPLLVRTRPMQCAANIDQSLVVYTNCACACSLCWLLLSSFGRWLLAVGSSWLIDWLIVWSSAGRLYRSMSGRSYSDWDEHFASPEDQASTPCLPCLSRPSDMKNRPLTGLSECQILRYCRF